MRVHGYKDDKEVVAVDLPLHEIAILEIDPFRLDLFDPDPVVHHVKGEPVYFSRLRDLVFAYRGPEKKIAVGAHDGIGSVALIGEQTQSSAKLINVRLSKRSFGEHLMRYLHSLDYLRSGQVYVDLGVFDCKGAQKQLHQPQIALFGPPRPHCELAIHGDTLAINWGELAGWRDPVCFQGAMFAEQAIDVPLPQPLNWVLQALAPFHPAIFGEAIWRTLQKWSLQHVEVSVFGEPDAVQAQLRLLGSCKREETSPISYTLVKDGVFKIVHRGAKQITFPLAEGENLYSLDCLCASTPNQIRGARLSLLDVGMGQSRAVRNLASQYNGSGDFWRNRQRFERLGLKILPTPSFEYAKVQHEGSQSVYATAVNSGLDTGSRFMDPKRTPSVD